jgi:hypothetical protein
MCEYKHISIIISYFNYYHQISPSANVREDYYEVDGMLTTKLEQVDVKTSEKKHPKCTADDANAVIGKGGVHYHKHGAFCLETQKFPDAVNHVSEKEDF